MLAIGRGDSCHDLPEARPQQSQKAMKTNIKG
jgi:hypothetical protein